MGQFSSFDALPIVVHDGILRSLASPRDVANLIRASPGSLQAYTTGGRNSVLLSTMRNLLCRENHQLMILVMAAPDYYDHTDPESTTDEMNEFRADFESEIRRYLDSFHSDDHGYKDDMRYLTHHVLEPSLRLYSIMEKAIRTYSLYTLARAQGWVNESSGPQTLESLIESPCSHHPAPDDAETQRLWRGFLLYELFCIMWSIPQITADAGYRVDSIRIDTDSIAAAFHDMPTHVVEEFHCVRKYAKEQYELGFNKVAESFKLAVAKAVRRPLSTRPSTPLEFDTTPAFDLAHLILPQQLNYLQGWPYPYDATNWIDNVSMLGVSFLQKFLSQSSAARLDFCRATYPFLHKKCLRRSFGLHLDLFLPGLSLIRLEDESFGWDWDKTDQGLLTLHRLRAVGWIFWENPDRLASMDLDSDRKHAAYGSRSRRPPHLSQQTRSFPLDNAIEPEDWAPLVRDFGNPVTELQLNQVERLFMSIDDLNFSEITSIMTGMTASPSIGPWAMRRRVSSTAPSGAMLDSLVYAARG